MLLFAADWRDVPDASSPDYLLALTPQNVPELANFTPEALAMEAARAAGMADEHRPGPHLPVGELPSISRTELHVRRGSGCQWPSRSM